MQRLYGLQRQQCPCHPQFRGSLLPYRAASKFSRLLVVRLAATASPRKLKSSERERGTHSPDRAKLPLYEPELSSDGIVQASLQL